MSYTDTILAAEDNLLIYRGDTLQGVYNFYEDEAATVPYDLSQWTELKLQIRVEKDSLDPVVELTLGNGLTVSGVANNVLTIDFTATQMDLLRDNYFYDVEGVNGSSVGTILRGSIKKVNDVTR